MISGVPQKFGQEYKATNTVCNEKKRMFSTDIATAYPAEAKVKSWVRSYALDDKKLIIGDIYTLDEAIAPNQMNFLTWGNVTFPSAGKIRIEVRDKRWKWTIRRSLKPNWKQSNWMIRACLTYGEKRFTASH